MEIGGEGEEDGEPQATVETDEATVKTDRALPERKMKRWGQYKDIDEVPGAMEGYEAYECESMIVGDTDSDEAGEGEEGCWEGFEDDSDGGVLL